MSLLEWGSLTADITTQRAQPHRIPDQPEPELLPEVMAQTSKRAAREKPEEYLATSLPKRRGAGDGKAAPAASQDFSKLRQE